MDGINDYTCNCTSIWMGKNCSEVYDACSFVPCKNGATCQTTKPSHNYNCTCLSGFTGRNCETNIDNCPNHTCASFQICQDGVNNYTCVCPLGMLLQYSSYVSFLISPILIILLVFPLLFQSSFPLLLSSFILLSISI